MRNMPSETARPLSRTERQVLELTRAGLTVDEVARRLFLTPATVRSVLVAAAPDQADSTPAQVSLK